MVIMWLLSWRILDASVRYSDNGSMFSLDLRDSHSGTLILVEQRVGNCVKHQQGKVTIEHAQVNKSRTQRLVNGNA